MSSKNVHLCNLQPKRQRPSGWWLNLFWKIGCWITHDIYFRLCRQRLSSGVSTFPMRDFLRFLVGIDHWFVMISHPRLLEVFTVFCLWWFQGFDIWNIAYMPFSNCLWRTVERKISFKGKYWEWCKNILLIERFSKLCGNALIHPLPSPALVGIT